jgi:hypothetical protein
MHGESGLVSRISTLEQRREREKGIAAGIGAVAGASGGAAMVAFWKVLAARIGL